MTEHEARAYFGLNDTDQIDKKGIKLLLDCRKAFLNQTISGEEKDKASIEIEALTTLLGCVPEGLN